MKLKFPLRSHVVDVCVVGGGIAGLIAAVSAARRGCRTMLIHDRPVLGGNASSEIRMWISGAHGKQRKEAGILEEIQLCNQHRNPHGLYSVWDSVLFEYATMTPGLTTLLNCTCNDGTMEAGRLASINAWQLTTQTWHRIEASFFIDSSGDSILAPLSGAETRVGREARDEFNESLAPLCKDAKTMGNSLLLQLEETGRPQVFAPPAWAYKFDENSTLPSRIGSGNGHNFWWLELGGLQDTIGDAESIRDELVKAAWGVWDYMKNRGPQAEMFRNWRLRWMGSLPGKRENRRYVGEHTLTQNDIESGGCFEDIVAYGGWSMDDHHPAGLCYPGKPTLFHRAPSPYGIPLRALYSRNVPNLFCAGRNISVTHNALASTRVMGTCAIIGQAVGTAAAFCIAHDCLPRDIYPSLISELQKQLMDDDCWLPGVPRSLPETLKDAELADSQGGDITPLLSGMERETEAITEHWEAPSGSSLTMCWKTPRPIECLRIVFDSDFNDKKQMPCRYSLGDEEMRLPGSLVKAFRVEVQSASGQWESIFEEHENRRRLYVLEVRKAVTGLRWTGLETWGDPMLRVFSIEPREDSLRPTQDVPEGISWTEVVARIDPADLKEPDHGLESQSTGMGRFGA